MHLLVIQCVVCVYPTLSVTYLDEVGAKIQLFYIWRNKHVLPHVAEAMDCGIVYCTPSEAYQTARCGLLLSTLMGRE